MNVSIFVIYRLVRRGLIRTIWIGSKLIVPSEEVERLSKEGAPTPKKCVRIRVPATAS